MSVALFDPVAAPPAQPELSVERTDITFSNVAPDRLAVEVAVRNLGRARSRPTVALIRSAPLGAFVPWRPLTAVAVPALEPGAETTVRAEVPVPAPVALGTPGRVPPRRLLTALAAGDPRPRAGGLAPDLFRLLGRGGVHWAGNLNVFIGGKDVERHLAQALRVYPGRTNLALFMVGSGRPDGYAFHVGGDAAGWNPRLLDMTGARSLSLEGRPGDGIPDGEWVELSHGILMLALEPPADATEGRVEVCVRQRSTDREAVVEFSLDARAAGPGCYVA
jgi:hypothetical protein